MHRSKGQGYVPTRLGTMYQYLYTRKDADNTEEYSVESPKVIAHMIWYYANSNKRRMSKNKIYQLVHIYSLQTQQFMICRVGLGDFYVSDYCQNK